MDILKDLAAIAGEKFVTCDDSVLSEYTADLSFTKASKPEAVVYPGTAEEVSKIVKWANENNMPLIPVSSPIHLYGTTVPKQGGVIVNMKRFDEVLEIDTVNRFVRFGVGVSWEKLTSELKKEGMRVIMPLAPRGNRSVATDHLEREVTTSMVYDYGEPTQSMQVVFPNGDIFRTGSASAPKFPYSPARGANPAGPGLDFYRLLQCAQGTMGIVTWMSLKIQSIPRIDKIKFAALDKLDDASGFLYRILPRRIGQECLVLNNVDLAALLASDAEEFQKYKAGLPHYTLILTISGLIRRPEEKIAYEEHFLSDVMRNEFQNIVLTDTLPGFPGASNKLIDILRSAWSESRPYWKNVPAGAYQDLFFITKPEKAECFVEIMKDICGKRSYTFESIGIYKQPIEHNRACQMMFTFYYDAECEKSAEAVKAVYRDAFEAMHDAGAYFTRPYGDMAERLYDRAASYTAALKKVKTLFDPNNVMNPGNLCF
ncbi:MAG: FAD-binding oxidoreductase [Firmicutes bacterium]|nr:FAD-binding oxidoreductase [Bacillota bacterium]